MVLRALRSHAKWVFFLLVVIPFVAWGVFRGASGLNEMGGAGGDVVLSVNGHKVHAPEFQRRSQNATELYRQQTGTTSLTKEDEQQIQDQVTNQLIQEILLQQEYGRLGIRVSDEEIIDAARTSPPPEVTNDPQFKTDGQFDIRKWQQFLQSGADRNTLAQIEAIYRDRIPQIKLAQYITSDVYVSDAKLWRMYKDAHDSVSVAVLPVWPYLITDSIAVGDAELQSYVDKHADDFKRPAMAFVQFIAIPRMPTTADSAAARARLAKVRAELARGVKFEDVARRESTDTVSGKQGGDLGWVRRDEPTFDPEFMAGLKGLAPGRVSAPVLSQFGYHLIRVDAAKGDSLKVRHILVAVDLLPDHLDAVEARVDSVERLAADQTNGALLDTAAHRFNLPVAPVYRIVDGERLTLGRYQIPDVGVWAFQAHVGETSPVVEAKPAYYVFRLDSLVSEGVPPLGDVREQVLRLVKLEKQKQISRRRADSLAAALRDTPNLPAIGTARGLPVQRFGPFTRLKPPSYLASEPLAVGAAFGLRVGERSGVIVGLRGDFIVESLGRKMADSSAWVKQKDAQRAQILNAVRQARIQQYVDGLRARAKIVDRRKEIFRTQASADAAAS